MSDVPVLKHCLPTFQCDYCLTTHEVTEEEAQNGLDGPAGWLVLRLQGYDADPIFEATVCCNDVCRGPVLQGLGFESYEEYLSVVKAVDSSLPRGDYVKEARALAREMIKTVLDDIEFESSDEKDSADPKTVDELMQMLDNSKDPWGLN